MVFHTIIKHIFRPKFSKNLKLKTIFLMVFLIKMIIFFYNRFYRGFIFKNNSTLLLLIQTFCNKFFNCFNDFILICQQLYRYSVYVKLIASKKDFEKFEINNQIPEIQYSIWFFLSIS